jgi:ectoine hydroxylase-related dioxygenase (phytanoyl-CoA dioxygenase family)
MDTFTFDKSASAADVAAAHAEHGVVVVRNCLPAATVATVQAYLTAELERVRTAFARLGITGPLEASGPQVTALLADGSNVANEDKHLLLGHFPLAVRLSETLRLIPSALGQLGFLQSMLGSRELFVHMPINARYILPRQTIAAVPTHQDVSYNTHMRGFCVAWVPFTEIDEDCSGMAVYPGSHRLGALAPPPTAQSSPGWLPKIEAQLGAPVPLLPLSPGDVAVFSELTVHESMANRSSRIRLNAEVRFFGDRAHTTKHYFDLQTGAVINPAETSHERRN